MEARIRPIAKAGGGRPGWDSTQAGQPARPGPTEHPPRKTAAKPDTRKADTRRTGRADGRHETRAPGGPGPTRKTRGPDPPRSTRGPAPRDPQESERAQQEYAKALGKIAYKLLSLADLDAVYDVKHSGRDVTLYMTRYGPRGWTLAIRVRKPPPELGWHMPSMDAQLTDLAGGFQVELAASTSYAVGASFFERRLSDNAQLPRASFVARAHLAIMLWWVRIAIDDLGISFAKLRGPGALDHAISRAISDFQEALTSPDPETCLRAGGPKLATALKLVNMLGTLPMPRSIAKHPPPSPSDSGRQRQSRGRGTRRNNSGQSNATAGLPPLSVECGDFTPVMRQGVAACLRSPSYAKSRLADWKKTALCVHRDKGANYGASERGMAALDAVFDFVKTTNDRSELAGAPFPTAGVHAAIGTLCR